VNAPRELGRHISGFPNQHLRAILAEHSVHRQALARGLRPAFANAYNEAYFRRPASRQSVTTHAVHAAGMPFRMMGDYRAGRAVFHDLTGELIRVQGNEDKLAPPSEEKPRVFKNRFARDREGFAAFAARMEMEVIDPREAGRRVAGLAADHDYVLFEYVKSDMMGHDTGRSWARDVVAEVMLFLRTVLERMDGERDTLLVASDHGNSEDLTVRTHTLAPVPAVAVGPLAEAILNRCEAITDIVPALLDALAGERRGG
jgi:hypothetical protein